MKSILSVFIFFASFTFFGQTPIKDIQNISDKIQVKVNKLISEYSPTIFVNPFIGTGGHGHTYPGASAPFGMMQLSPDTRYDGWDGCSGYHYSDSIIYGFSHTHLSGTGVPDYCDLLIVPQSNTPKTLPGYLNKNGYGSTFKHESEKASPGFYGVYLDQSNIQVRLTVSQRAGIHEYTFNNKDEKRYILIDLDHRDRVLDYSLETIGNNTVQGARISKAWANKQHFYFYLETSLPFIKSTKINEKGQHKLLLEFPNNIDKISLRVGMSAADILGAKENLLSEIPEWNFEKVRANTVKQWNDELGKIKISLEDKEKATIFYTALYHSYLVPNIFSDVNGKYRGRDNKIHTISNEQKQYTVFSLWDTYRATHPLFTLMQQKRTNEFITTFLRQFDEGKDLPVWELSGNETECMIGYHSVSVIADAYLKGINQFDTTKALSAMITTAKLNEYAKIPYAKNGFIDSDQEPESVSKTLEYAYDDWCISEMAKKMGDKKSEKEFELRSFNFLNLYDPQTKFMRAKRAAQWFSPFEPSEVNFNYTEANAFQYSMAAPQAIKTLAEIQGGADSLESWLDRLFTSQSKLSGREQSDITGLIGQYAHGNEPSHHMAYLYNYTNSPHKTQFYIDKITKELYSNSPDGLSGNEDCGQMSSWFVLSSLGFYPVAPGKPYYEIGRPCFSEAVIKFENNKSLRISAINNSPENKYIRSVKLNGLPIYRSYLSHEEIMNGGVLEFEMSDSIKNLNDKWISGSPENSIPSNFVPVPFILNESRIFDTKISIEMGFLKINSQDEFTLFYSIKKGVWNKYSKPFEIDKSTLIELKLQRKLSSGELFESQIVNRYFKKKDNSIRLDLKTKYANQYAASGPNSLIDEIEGGNEFRTGDWQGFYGEDILADVSFESPRELQEFGISCIRDQKSWIFLPSRIQIEISQDGKNFEKLEFINIPQATDKDENPKKEKFLVKLPLAKKVISIRYKVFNPGNCPEWHLGNGNPTWLFLDELIFN
jgi:predicted alpha-1,2-mannosidase